MKKKVTPEIQKAFQKLQTQFINDVNKKVYPHKGAREERVARATHFALEDYLNSDVLS